MAASSQAGPSASSSTGVGSPIRVAFDPDTAPDRFEWSRDRERAIESALGGMAEEPLSLVGSQLAALRRALVGGTMTDVEGLIGEVERFITFRQDEAAARPVPSHEGVQAARADIGLALGLYAEVCGLLRRFADSREGTLAVLSERLEDEARDALLRARDRLVSSRPPR